MLLLLEAQELTVSELCTVMQLPQSTVSRQLKTLADAGWVTSRRDGTSRYYSLSLSNDDARTLWTVTRAQVAGKSGADQDRRRLARVLAERSAGSEKFFASSADQWDRLRDEMFGGDFAFRAIGALVDDEWTVADLGCGTGMMASLLAPHVTRVIGIDASQEMLDAARERLKATANVELKRGTLEELPLADGSVDAATLMLVLHHVPAPAQALAEAARVLKPGGRVLIVDMAPHEKEEYRQQMGHVWLGFAEDQMKKMLAAAGFARVKVHALPASTSAKGPALFVATGRKHS